MSMQILIGGLIGAIIAIMQIYFERKDKLYIGQKIYYYLDDENKYYSGRIMAIINLNREEDITKPASLKRILSFNERKIQFSKSVIYEIQPIIGGSRIILSEKNILKEKLKSISNFRE